MADSTGTSLRELQLKEAEWVYEEMEDFVRLIQRYRGLFITAVFAAVGWLLGQALTAAPPGGTTPGATLIALRQRPDIAAVFCIVPLLNALFVVLMLEAQFQMQSLARYRFVLGAVLNDGTPVWQWERWKETREGSVRAWTNPSNIYFGLVAVTLPVAALWFAWPAVLLAGSGMLWTFWLGAAAISASLVVLVVVVGWRNRHKNRVARPIRKEDWDELWPSESAKVFPPAKPTE